MQSTLALYGSGRTTGVVVDCGDGVTHVVPIVDGYCLSHAIARTDLAGANVTTYLCRLLNERGYSLTTGAEMEIVRDIKERLASVAIEQDELTTSEVLQQYRMPDERMLQIGGERRQCMEALFRPSLLGMESDGLSSMVFDALQRCAVDLRRQLFGNVILCGGTSCAPGFGDRLHRDLAALASSPVKVTPAQSKYATWTGGSIMASLPSARSLFMSHADYQEHGSAVVHQKFVQ
jgi:actin